MLAVSRERKLTMEGKAMPSEYTLTYLDYDGEKSPAKFTGPAPVQSGFDSWELLLVALKNAIANITLGTLNKEVRSSSVTTVSNDPPTSEIAQREHKWLVTYRANTSQKIFRLEIPCADLTGHLLPASKEADLEETDMAAFVSAFEAFVRSPDNGTEAVTVLKIINVGRNI
jgi:hypothetical protein